MVATGKINTTAKYDFQYSNLPTAEQRESPKQYWEVFFAVSASSNFFCRSMATIVAKYVAKYIIHV